MQSMSDLRDEVTKANKTYFDAIFDCYEVDPRQKYGLFAENARSRYREVIKENLGIIRKGLVINVACGTGNMMDIENGYGLNSVGFDISINMLKLARRYTTRMFVGDFYAMPFKDRSVSFAAGFALLHHVYDHAAFLHELNRVLMPGGLFYADYDPNYYTVAKIKKHPITAPVWQIYEQHSDRVRKLDRVDPETFALADYYAVREYGLRYESLEKSLRQAGFKEVQVIPHSDGPSLRQPRHGRLPHKVLEGLLWLLGEKDYARRAKNLAVIARKGP